MWIHLRRIFKTYIATQCSYVMLVKKNCDVNFQVFWLCISFWGSLMMLDFVSSLFLYLHFSLSWKSLCMTLNVMQRGGGDEEVGRAYEWESCQLQPSVWVQVCGSPRVSGFELPMHSNLYLSIKYYCGELFPWCVRSLVCTLSVVLSWRAWLDFADATEQLDPG